MCSIQCSFLSYWYQNKLQCKMFSESIVGGKKCTIVLTNVVCKAAAVASDVSCVTVNYVRLKYKYS